MISKRRAKVESTVFAALALGLCLVVPRGPGGLFRLLPWLLLAAFWLLVLTRWRYIARPDSRPGDRAS